jgi:flagellar motility protein MotE (MotC chaperone)
MNRSVRLLPFTMLVAFLLLGLKVGEVMRDGRILLSFTKEARAQAEQTPAKDAKSKDVPEKPAAKKDVEAKPVEAEKKEGDAKVNPPSTDPDSEEEQTPPKRDFSQVEVDLLQSLAKRRQELDDWAKQIQLKENMLIATEQRINDKIESLQKMKKELENLLAQYNEQEDTKIRSLVKIYENMKPKDAARIFEELDMPVLLTVVDRMSERKVAPVLASMNPTKAKDVTVQLAEQRKLQKPRPGNATAPQTAAPANSAPNSPATTPAVQPNPSAGR